MTEEGRDESTNALEFIFLITCKSLWKCLTQFYTVFILFNHTMKSNIWKFEIIISVSILSPTFGNYCKKKKSHWGIDLSNTPKAFWFVRNPSRFSWATQLVSLKLVANSKVWCRFCLFYNLNSRNKKRPFQFMKENVYF